MTVVEIVQKWHQLKKCWTALKHYIRTHNSTVRVNDELINSIMIGQSVKQGCTLSPTLLNVYIHDLVDGLNREAKGISFGDC